MDYEFVFKKGEHKGKTVEWVQDNYPDYMIWVEECKPELLGDEEEKNLDEPKYEEPELDKPESAIKPNLDFYNEK